MPCRREQMLKVHPAHREVVNILQGVAGQLPGVLLVVILLSMGYTTTVALRTLGEPAVRLH